MSGLEMTFSVELKPPIVRRWSSNSKYSTEKKRTENLMEMLELKETVVRMGKANGVRCYGHVLRRDEGHVLRKVLEFEVKGKRKRGLPKKTLKMQVEKESKSVGLEKEDTTNRARWRVGVGEIAIRVG